jgi:hypothetical protein
MEEIDLDFILCVVYSRACFNGKNCDENSSQLHLERNESSCESRDDYMPNFVSVWCDSNWSGLYEYATDIIRHSKHESCSIFKIQGKMTHRDPSFLQLFQWNAYKLLNHGDKSSITICNSIKLHFFHARNIKGFQEDRLKRDFLYSSSIPLIQCEQSKKGNVYSDTVFGVFNYNVNENVCECIPHIRLVVHRVSTHIPVMDIRLLSMTGPTKILHNDMLKISEWFQCMLQILCPASKSNFLNIRTLCRDYGNSLPFQFLTELFKVPMGPSLPLEMVLYCLYHALILNRMQPSNFRNIILNLFNVSRSDMRLFMRIIRDTIVPWTMCSFEGLYVADTSLGQNVEDQPFPFSFLPGNRVFHKDDCEGRMSEAQQMKEAFISFFHTVECNGCISDFISELSHSLYQKDHKLTRMALSIETWVHLLHISYVIGSLFDTMRLELHTTVGDVNFSSFSSENVEHQSTPSCRGHSFGILLLRDGVQSYTYCSLIEATGWERNILESDRKLSAHEIECTAEIINLKNKHKLQDINLCGHLSDERENNVYQNICLGNDSIFFTVNSVESGSQLDYGTSLSNLKRGDLISICYDQLHPYRHLQVSNKGYNCLSINTLGFIEEMISLYEHMIRKDQKHAKPSFFLETNIISKTFIHDKEENLRTLLKSSMEIRGLMKSFIDNIPMIRRCLATPSKYEAEYLHIMSSKWRIINEDNVKSIMAKNEMCKGLYLSCLEEETARKIASHLRSKYSNVQITIHPCMRSLVLNVCMT